ncbi:hypothetical protein [Flavobacterium sp.]|jgi:hypothetical protein|uniref:hypothetical protein n=1 Tax=Flavobacterium sp. TaxID=239 RepID=UPI0037BF2430
MENDSTINNVAYVNAKFDVLYYLDNQKNCIVKLHEIKHNEKLIYFKPINPKQNGGYFVDEKGLIEFPLSDKDYLIEFIEAKTLNVNENSKASAFDSTNKTQEEYAKLLFTELINKADNNNIKNRITSVINLNDIKNEDFLNFLSNSKSFISASILSDDLKIILIDSLDYLESIKDYDNSNSINKKIDIINNLETSYNDEIFINYVEKNNFPEGLKHAELLKKILYFFVDETLPHVYDTIANLYLSNNRLIEAESEIIKCLQIEAIEDDENTEHNFTAAKIYYKKNDLINGLKYYNKAIELGADNDLIKDFQEFLNNNEINV